MSSSSPSSVSKLSGTSVIPAKPSESNNENDLSHPLFHMAIVRRLKEKIPIINRMQIFVENNYGRIKSSSNMISIVIGKVENGVNLFAIKIVHYVPRKPVELIDKMACYGLDMIDKRLRQMFELSIIVSDNVVQIPMAIGHQYTQLITINGFYDKLNQFLLSLESKLEYLMPLPEPHHQKDDQKDVKTIIDLLWRFIQHLNEHLKHYVKGHIFIIRMITIVDRFKPGFIKLPFVSTQSLTNDKKVIKSDVSNNVIEKNSIEMISINNDSSKSNDQQTNNKSKFSTDNIVEIKSTKPEIEQFKDQVTAVVDQIVSNSTMMMDKKIDNQITVNHHLNGHNNDLINVVANNNIHQQQQQQNENKSAIKDYEKVNGQQPKLQQQQQQQQQESQQQEVSNKIKNNKAQSLSSSTSTSTSFTPTSGKIQSNKSVKSSKKQQPSSTTTTTTTSSTTSANGF
uniref:Probable E3 ubiquitin-protein ligase bre1 n=1 Tax=Dermatophagoides pteronyssinus TaxID=6956 RepID=A0A6P6Y3H6_DERPT|nr:probable E3 ubiquitin-protein ligase bre1 [Dermatophagoides pteronyssinus]